MIDFVQSSDISIPCLFELSEIKCQAFSVVNGVVWHEKACIFPESCKVEHNLFGDAAYIDTSAADGLVLNQSHFFAMLRCPAS